MKTDKVIVKKSNIEGKGVFALRDFKKGEIVLHWDISHTLPKVKVEKMSNKEKEYINFLDGKYVIMQDPEKYLNHQCEPNTTVKNFCDKEMPLNTSMKCNCGSKKCKKIIRN